MRNRPTNFLFDGQEESGGQSKRNKPHRDNWFEAILSKSLLPNLEKDIGRDAGNEQADANRDGAFGQCNF